MKQEKDNDYISEAKRLRSQIAQGQLSVNDLVGMIVDSKKQIDFYKVRCVEIKKELNELECDYQEMVDHHDTEKNES